MLSTEIRQQLEHLSGTMDEIQLKEVLRGIGALVYASDMPISRESMVHFMVKPGWHTGRFYAMQRAFQYRSFCNLFALILINKLPDDILRSITMLAGPERRAIPLLHTLKHYFPNKEVKTVTLERRGDVGALPLFGIPRGISIDRDDRVLLVDDVFNTGDTMIASIEAIPALVMAAVVSINRAPASRTFEHSTPTVPLFWVIRDPLLAHPVDDCPYCKEEIELIEL